MYKETEFTYKNFNIEEYKAEGEWHFDYWWRNDPLICGTVKNVKKKLARRQVADIIDKIEEALKTGNEEFIKGLKDANNSL